MHPLPKQIFPEAIVSFKVFSVVLWTHLNAEMNVVSHDRM